MVSPQSIMAAFKFSSLSERFPRLKPFDLMLETDPAGNRLDDSISPHLGLRTSTGILSSAEFIKIPFCFLQIHTPKNMPTQRKNIK
jgi:hypothetical protein